MQTHQDWNREFGTCPGDSGEEFCKKLWCCLLTHTQLSSLSGSSFPGSWDAEPLHALWWSAQECVYRCLMLVWATEEIKEPYTHTHTLVPCCWRCSDLGFEVAGYRIQTGDRVWAFGEVWGLPLCLDCDDKEGPSSSGEVEEGELYICCWIHADALILHTALGVVVSKVVILAVLSRSKRRSCAKGKAGCLIGKGAKLLHNSESPPWIKTMCIFLRHNQSRGVRPWADQRNVFSGAFFQYFHLKLTF